MRLPLTCLTVTLACAAAMCACTDDAFAVPPGFDELADGAQSVGHPIMMLSGGGRIWEGESVSQPTADITFSGHIAKIGPGTLPGDYRCQWSVHFQDVQGSEFDGTTFTGRTCVDATAWTAGGDPDIGLRVILHGTLNGVPGYSLVINAVDMTDPGKQDQIRFRLVLGEIVAGSGDPWNVIYDTNCEFTLYPQTQQRTYLDSGNLQSKVESL